MKKLLFALPVVALFAAGCNPYPTTPIQPVVRNISPTATSSTDVKKIPQDKCPCWDTKTNTCHPQQDCE